MNSSESIAIKSGRPTTLTFLICAVALAAAVYFVVPRITMYMMVLDEQAKAKLKYEESLKPNLSTEVEIVTGPKKRPMGASFGGPSPDAPPASNEPSSTGN